MMQLQTDERLLQSLLLALLLHVGILLLITTGIALSPLSLAPEMPHFQGVAIMKAHAVTPPPPHHPAMPPAVVKATPPAPAPVHGATGLVKATAQPLHPKHRAELQAAEIQAPHSPDKVPAVKKPVQAVARPKTRPEPHIDQKQADDELNAIAQEAHQLDAEKAAEQKIAAEDAAERAAADKLARQQQSQQQAKMLDTYRRRITEAIRQHWIQPLCAESAMFVVMTLQLLPDGSVAGVTMNQPNACLNLSVRNAIDQVGSLPVPEDPSLFEHYFRTLKLRFRPLDN